MICGLGKQSRRSWQINGIQYGLDQCTGGSMVASHHLSLLTAPQLLGPPLPKFYRQFKGL